MAINRGIQSAIFYYLSCAPCADARYRKKRKREAAISRAERLALEEEEDNLYRHPGEPSSTNPGWHSEIALGPTLVSRGKKGKTNTNTSSTKGFAKGGRLGSISSGGNHPSSLDLPQRGNSDDSRWNFRSYQREDEELWGSTNNLDGSQYSASIRIPERVRTNDSRMTSTSYHSKRNPPVNDLHPATVTKVETRDDVLWMFQPPPVAEVMNGKERATTRSRSDSGGSRFSPSSTNLSRQASQRLMEQRLRGAGASTAMSRQSSSQTANGSVGQRHDRISERDFATTPSPKERHRPPPIQIPTEGSDESADTIIRKPELAATSLPMHHAASRPQLSTIVSDDSNPADRFSPDFMLRSENPTENELPTPPQSSSDSSRKNDMLARRSTIAAPDKLLSSGMTQGKVIRTGHKHEESDISIRPELFDSWYTPDFEPLKWVHEHTKREVKERWSMDL